MLFKLHCVAPFKVELAPPSSVLETLKIYLSNHCTEYTLATDEPLKKLQQNCSRYEYIDVDSNLSQDKMEKIFIRKLNPISQQIENRGEILIADNGTAILYSAIEIESSFEDELCMRLFQEQSNEMMNKIIKSFITHVFGSCHQSDIYTAKWVNRTLEISTDVFNQFEACLKSKWLYSEDEISLEFLKNGYYFAWGNNIISEEADYSTKINLFSTITTMQYHYSLLDDANEAMKDFINNLLIQKKDIQKRNSRWISKRKIMGYINQIESVRFDINNILIKYNDDMLNLQSFKQQFASKISVVWKFDQLVASIREKVSLSEDELNHMKTTATNNARFITDIILFLVGLTGALSFVLGLGDILDARNSVSIRGFSDYMSHLPNAINEYLLNSFTGALNSISFIVLFLVIIIYTLNRRE